MTQDPFDDLLGTLALRAVSGNPTLLECPIAGPRVRVHRDLMLAWGDGAGLQVVHGRAGDELAFGRVQGGLRGYLAVGDREGVVCPVPVREDRTIIRAFRGPHDVGLEDVECTVTPLLDRVGIRLRPLQELHVEIPADLRSIGMQCGTVQLHPDGSLVAMGPDHPVTGGYLQPMTVISTERWKLAQLMPGERVLLRATQPPNW